MFSVSLKPLFPVPHFYLFLYLSAAHAASVVFVVSFSCAFFVSARMNRFIVDKTYLGSMIMALAD
jgi:hypothetical protein